MIIRTVNYDGRDYVGSGDDKRSAYSDACSRIVVDAILSYFIENGVYPAFNDIPKYKKLKSIVFCIHFTIIRRYLSGDKETVVDLSIEYKGRSFFGSGTSIIQAKFNACLNATKVSLHFPSTSKISRIERIASISTARSLNAKSNLVLTTLNDSKTEVNVNGKTPTENCSALSSTSTLTSVELNILDTYPAYKSYESFKEKHKSDKIPHPVMILSDVLKKRPGSDKIQLEDDLWIFKTTIGDKKYTSESKVKKIGNYESSLKAFLDVCKDPVERAKFDHYMATLAASKNNICSNILEATEAKTSISKLAAPKNTVQNTVPSVNSLANTVTCPAPVNQPFLEAYLAYKSYDLFVEEQRVKDVPHPTKILEEILQKKLTFEQVKAFGIFGARMVIYKIRVEDHLYQSHSNVDHIGTFECALKAVVDFYKNLSEREKINQYMATLNGSDILETYPAYKSYESFRQNQNSAKIPHPSWILSDLLRKKPGFSKFQLQGGLFIYLTWVGDKMFLSKSNVVEIGSYESSLKAFLDVCKDPVERAKFDHYMATLTASKKEIQANQSTWDQLLFAEVYSTPDNRKTIKNRRKRHNRRIRDSAISDLSVGHMVLGQNADQQRVDRVRNMVLEKYVEAMKDRFEEYLPFKVIAGFVMERGSGQLEVVSVATGTKTAHGEYLSRQGAVINDSHAEVLARRGLVSFFFSELEKALEGEESIFILSVMKCADKENGFNSIQCYKLKEGTKFHLYVSKTPCGDACNFSPHETEMTNSKTAGKLRIKTECEEGTKQVPKMGDILTWDGIVCGQKLLTMSCSDKISRWNVLGLQGCLLSTLVQPIYLSSLIIGSKLKKAHVERAIAGRLDPLRDTLVAPFKLNQPEVFQTSDPDPRHLSATAYCVNWTRHHNSVEILAGFTGRPLNEKEGVSRLSKRSFFRTFKGLVSKIYEVDSFNYGETKNKIADYQSAKQLFFDMCLERGLGKWVKKPEELNEFNLQLSN